MMDGDGVMTWTDGRKYTGQFYEDKKDGQGILVWADGRKYDGTWSEG